MRLCFAVLLISPPFLACLAPLMELARVGSPPDWLSVANHFHFPLALFLLGSPILVKVLLRRSPGAAVASGVDPDQLVLLLGVGGAITVVTFAFLLIPFAGGSVSRVYFWVPVSMASAVFWCWRYRQLFR
jgi:hypothetical protein